MAFAKTLTMGAAAAVLALAAGGASATSVKVGVLSRHDPAAWSSESQCLAGANLDLIQCNLEVYGAAVAEAAASQVELLVFPEGYGLSNTIARSGFFEPFDEATPFGTVQCTSAENATLPQQVALSCAAMKTGVALVANVFTQREEDGSRHITDIVYDGDGALVAWYHKHVLFPSEKKVVEPGPFAPTTFDLLGHRWGLLICYEGLYPSLTGDDSQLSALAAAGAEAFLWSIGADMPMAALAASFGEDYGVGVVATEDKGPGGVFTDAAGAAVRHADAALDAPGGYLAVAQLRTATILA